MKVKYNRVSTLQQTGDRFSIDKENYDLVLFDKVSGTIPFNERPKGIELVNLIKNNKVSELVVEEFSRLGRNTGDVIRTLEWLDENVKDFSPKIIIQIVDQTDFGDELCRYLNVRSVNLDGSVTVLAFDGVDTENQTVYSIKDKLRYSIILNSSTLNTIKLFKLAYFRVLNRLAPVKDCGWNEISNYLLNGLNSEEENYMIDMFVPF